MGQRFAPECKYQVQWSASCLGAACPRISLCYMLSKVKSWRIRKCTCIDLPLCSIYDQLPLWPIHRHNTYLQECTGQREPTYQLNIHDTKLLFLRFATEQSFSVDTGGGGRESNIHLIPYIIHTVLYVLNTCVAGWCGCCDDNVCKMRQLMNSFDSTRATSREEKNLQSFQDQPCEKWVESSYDVEGPHYYTIFAMHIMPPERWRTSRLYFLRRLLVTAHARKVSAVSTNK